MARWFWLGAAALLSTYLLASGVSAGAAQNGQQVPELLHASGPPWGHAQISSLAQPHSAPARWVLPFTPHTTGGSYTAESTNWSGQIATGTTFSGITGSWVVPKVQPTTTSEASGTWIGIDGGASSPSTILQTGTEQDPVGGGANYFAWYEVFPNPPVVLAAVSPGDQINASIAQGSGTTWTLAMTDVTSGRILVSGPITYTGPGDSAEWIEELPTSASPPQPYLANFASVVFVQASLIAADPLATVISPIDMTDAYGNVIARTGAFVNTTFGITYVPEPTTTAVSVNPTFSSYGNPVTYSATVGSPGPVPTGTVTFTDGSTPLCTADLFDGSGSCRATNTPQGNDVVEGRYSGDANSASSSGTTGLAVGPPRQPGYWLVGSDGGIFSFGSAQFYGSTGNLRLQRPVVGIAPTRDDAGYWLDAADGGVFGFGDTQFYGSIPGLGIHPAGSGLPHSLNAPIVGMVPSADGGGYVMVASDGGVFAFGDAHFAGSCPGIGACSGAAVAVMPDANGNGYWLVTRTGHLYAFGGAPYLGAPGNTGSQVTSAVRTADGGGYWILTANGNIYPYGDARTYVGLTGAFGGFNTATAIFTTSDGNGYWVATANGLVINYGDAPNDGNMVGTPLNGIIIAATGF